jgi:hypothetical protein
MMNQLKKILSILEERVQRSGLKSSTFFILIIALFVSGSLFHSVGLAASVSFSALLLIDPFSISMVGLSFSTYLAASIVMARLLNELIGSEFAYKRFRRDREAGRTLLPFQRYIKENDDTAGFLLVIFSLLAFLYLYMPTLQGICFFVAPIVLYMFFYMLHSYWAWVNNFCRPGQLAGVLRLWKIFQRKPLRAVLVFAHLFFTWVRPRLLGLAALLMLSSGYARGVSLESSALASFRYSDEVVGAIIFRNSEGFILSTRSPDRAWFLGSNGLVLEIPN